MKSFINRLTSNWNLAAFILVFHSWAWATVGRLAGSPQAKILAGIFVIIAGGLIMRLRWARLTGLAVLIWLTGSKFYGLIFREFNWRQMFFAVGIGSLAYYLWKEPNNGFFDDFFAGNSSESGNEKDEEHKPIISLVHLRREPRYLEPQVLANALSEAWGLRIISGEEEEEGSDGFVAGDNPLFLVMVRKPVFAMFMVHNRDTGYFDDAEVMAARVPNLRFAEIIREHRAWLAVDLMQVKDTQIDQDAAYRLIGKAVSTLADDDVMAILCPQHQYFNLWSPEVEKLLCGDSPLDALREEVKAPVVGVPDGEAIEKAISEARRRWPEFVEIFKKRQPDDERFIVKAPFTGDDGHVEHMWMQVFGLEPEYVHGHLVNHPMHTTKLRQGSQVEVPVADVSDWLCPDAEGNPLGNFTHKAITEAAGRVGQA